MLIMVILYIVGVLFYCILPLWFQIPLMLLNTLIPDPIPFLDEVIMYGSVVKKCLSAIAGIEWIDQHRKLTTVGVILIICLIIILLVII